MKTALAEKLEAAAVQTVNLADLLQLDPSQLKPVHFRKAEKNLLLLEDLLHSNLLNQANRWLKRKNAHQILAKRLALVADLQTQIMRMDASLACLDEDLEVALKMPEAKLSKFQDASIKAQKYISQNIEMSEGAIVHRYERFQKLKSLTPYADNAQFLCDAIHHFENRDRYELNRDRLLKKRDDAIIRLQNVRRGFFLALVFCCLVVTLPICAPFAYSLYQRKKTISSQIANIDEVVRRETKRIQAADEGVIAAQEIRDTLGDVPLEVVKMTLLEVADLRREFFAFQPSQSDTAQLIHFFEAEESEIRFLFGTAPASVVEKINWFLQNHEILMEKLSNRTKILNNRKEVKQHINLLLNGNDQSVIANSLELLVEQDLQNPCPWTEMQHLVDFVEVLKILPALLFSTGEALWKLSHGQNLDLLSWQKLGVALRSQSNVLSACSLELTLSSPSLERINAAEPFVSFGNLSNNGDTFRSNAI